METKEMEQKKHRVYRVVLTGGPCGGKTTGQSRLCTFFENLGWKVFRVPETATVLLSGGIKFSDLSVDEDNNETCTCPHCVARVTSSNSKITSEAICFQENLLKTMIQIEGTFFSLAESSSRDTLIICDRGAMDASAFIAPEKWENIMQANGWNSVELRDTRYNQILHMVSAAQGAEDFYSTEEHACRSEDVELARSLDWRAAQAWIGHPYFDVIDNSTDFETKIIRMIESVCMKLGIDTGDRLNTNSQKVKFLVRGPLPHESKFPTFQDFDVVHHYLQTACKKSQVRLRKRGQNGHWSYTHAIRKPKIKGQVVEVKTQITQRDYVNMLAQKDDSHFTIYKKRRCFLDNSQYFQLDVYKEPGHKRCQGLILLETYTSLSKSEMWSRLPKFLKVEREVTGDPAYSMFNLSLKEEWDNSTKFCVRMADPEEEIVAPPQIAENGISSSKDSRLVNGV